jgi:hypothetical protein
MTQENANKPSGSGGGQNRNRRRRPNKNRNNQNRNQNRDKNNQRNAGSKPGGAQAQAGSKPNKSPNKKSSNNRRRRYSNNRRRGNNKVQKLTGLDYITTKYLNLLDQHLQARKKYFENFSRVNPKQLEKLERNYVESQKAFLVFKERLNTEDRELFEKRYESLKLDTTYSSNHELPVGPVEVNFTEEEIQDPHLLQSQMESNFNEDTEESTGSYDDYKAYKGIV